MIYWGIGAVLLFIALVFHSEWSNSNFASAVANTFESLVNWALFALIFVFFCVGFFVGGIVHVIEIKEFKSISIKQVDKQTLESLPSIPVKEIENEKNRSQIFEIYVPVTMKDANDEKEQTYLHTIRITTDR